ncbi:hypothetical protein ACPMJQ_11985 [Streptomyces pseudogriseolus]|uniref:hypothetical protein n=1 Tax=Streptomyces pseudogriseolus TaxID=36817 RepID=UPI003FA255DB
MSAPFPSQANAIPSAPVRPALPKDERGALAKNVEDALQALPIHFKTNTNIEGIEAGDLFSLSGVLGGTIEIQTVETLNRLRPVWDPDDLWPDYGFERSSQAYPDVRLVTRSSGKEPIVLGIELKGWYLLSKEEEPSYRYVATKEASSPYDLICVVPWHLNNILSGVPKVLPPYIENARFAADMRTYYWTQLRGKTEEDRRIITPQGVSPYPSSKKQSSDTAAKDSGNFGRIARVPGLMKEYSKGMLETRILGIQARHWIRFFKAYSDAASMEEVEQKLQKLIEQNSGSNPSENSTLAAQKLFEIRDLLA